MSVVNFNQYGCWLGVSVRLVHDANICDLKNILQSIALNVQSKVRLRYLLSKFYVAYCDEC